LFSKPNKTTTAESVLNKTNLRNETKQTLDERLRNETKLFWTIWNETKFRFLLSKISRMFWFYVLWTKCTKFRPNYYFSFGFLFRETKNKIKIKFSGGVGSVHLVGNEWSQLLCAWPLVQPSPGQRWAPVCEIWQENLIKCYHNSMLCRP
jgi:hypothetical protein